MEHCVFQNDGDSSFYVTMENGFVGPFDGFEEAYNVAEYFTEEDEEDG